MKCIVFQNFLFFFVGIYFNFKFMKGTVKWFDSAKGYGFITTEEGSDIFVHYTGINKEGFRGLEEGQNVQFEVSDGKKGEQAINVEVVA